MKIETINSYFSFQKVEGLLRNSLYNVEKKLPSQLDEDCNFIQLINGIKFFMRYLL